MSRFALFMAMCLMMFGMVSSEVVVLDNFGNMVGLPLQGGDADTGGFTITGSQVSTSPYILYLFIDDTTVESPTICTSGTCPTNEMFWFNTQNFGAATLVSDTYQASNPNNSNTGACQTAPPNNPCTYGPVYPGSPLGSYLGTAAAPNTNIGVYTFTFNIPIGQRGTFNLTYDSTVNPELIDTLFISVDNPIPSTPVVPTIVGDPQFVGLRGQSYQVHGVDGAVYNIITEPTTQINARFVFLTQGQCPIIDGVADTNCWSHPGSYLGEIGVQQIVDGKLHAALITAGTAKQGFAAVTLDGKALKTGETKSYGAFKLTYVSAYRVIVSTTNYEIELSNSDLFVNQALKAKVALSKLSSHGLLGQTHSTKVYPTALRYIEGSVDDYTIADSDIFGTEFVYNQFQNPQAQ